MNFKVIVSDPKTRKAYSIEKEHAATGLIGKKIGERFAGDALGLTQYELEVTGGSDKQGFPMRRDIEGAVRKRALLAMPPGFRPKIKGQRKRKSVRGNTISVDIVQINAKVTKHGPKGIEELLGVKKVEKKEEKAEEKSAEKKEEKSSEKKEIKEEKPQEKKEVKEQAEIKEKPTAEKAEKKMGIKKLDESEDSEK